MPTKPLERLLFAQGNRCFFCDEALPLSEASVEHLVAKTNGGKNDDDNTVACCKALNALLGKKSLKEKLGVVLKQKGPFKCPNRASRAPKQTAAASDQVMRVVTDLQKRGNARPGTITKLESTINNVFQNALNDAQVKAIVKELITKGYVLCQGNKVSYQLPAVTLASNNTASR